MAKKVAKSIKFKKIETERALGTERSETGCFRDLRNAKMTVI
jgi:hypothetical protein